MSQTVTMKPRSGRQLDKRRALVVYVVQQESWGVPYLFAEVWVSPKKSLLVTTYGGLHGTLNTFIDTRPPTPPAGRDSRGFQVDHRRVGPRRAAAGGMRCWQ